MLIWTELPIVSLIIGSDNIFDREVNRALAMHVIVHNLLIRNRLKFWISDSCFDIYLLMTLKDDLKSGNFSPIIISKYITFFILNYNKSI